MFIFNINYEQTRRKAQTQRLSLPAAMDPPSQISYVDSLICIFVFIFISAQLIAETHPSTRLVRGHIHHQPWLRSCNFLLVVRGNLFLDFFFFRANAITNINTWCQRDFWHSVVCFKTKYKYAPGVRRHSVTALLVGLFVFGAPTQSLSSKCCRDHLGYHCTRLESRRMDGWMDGPPGFSSTIFITIGL